MTFATGYGPVETSFLFLASTQSAMLLQQEEGMRDSVAANPTIDTVAPPVKEASANVPASKRSSSANADNSMQVNLDFGIEPVRASRST